MKTVRITDVLTHRTRVVPHTPDIVKCGHCNRSWDDSIATSLTPAPSARCPFEYQHKYPEVVKRGPDPLAVALEAVRAALDRNAADLRGIDDITPNRAMLRARAKLLRAAIAKCEV